MTGYYNFLLPFKNRGSQDDIHEMTIFLIVKPCTGESISSIYRTSSYHENGDSRFYRKGVKFVLKYTAPRRTQNTQHHAAHKMHSTTPHTKYTAPLRKRNRLNSGHVD
jgi:hypothetical protein